MKSNYVATVMNRHYIDNNMFIFSCDHVMFGNLDKKNGTFVDRSGNVYNSMLGKESLLSSNPYSCSNIIELNKLKNEYKNENNLTDVITLYERACKETIYIVSNCDDVVKCLAFNVSAVKNAGVNDEDYDYDYTADDFSNNIKDLILHVVNGDYSIDELRNIREDLMCYHDDFEDAIDSVDLQIEATEKGQSYISLSKEKIKENEDSDRAVVRNKFRRSNDIVLPIDIEELFNQVTKTLIAQDEPARRVIAEIARKELDERKKREGILLTGSTGVGKTELMRLIAKYLNKPFFIIDSTQLTIPGYTGKDIEEALWELIDKCGGDVSVAENAIVFFDEIDKKGSRKKSDVSGQGVLNTLLQFIEGTTYMAKPDSKSSESVEIDTTNMTVILGGAFTDVYKNQLEKHGIGFTTSSDDNIKNKKQPTTSDFIEKGMMTDEFMGRVTVIKLNDLEVDDIIRIMKESDSSAMHIQEEIFKKLGTKIHFTDDFTREIAEEAYKKKTGARGLNGIIDESTWRAFDEVYCNPNEYEEVILNKETVHDPTKYQLVKRKGINNN